MSRGFHSNWWQGTAAERGAFSTALLAVPFFWYETDTRDTYQWDGVAWLSIDVGGSGANTQVAYWTGPSVIAGDAGMAYNAATDTLTIVNVVISGLGAGAVQSTAIGAIISGLLPLTYLASYTQGDLIYGGAAGWADLANPGVANHVLQSTAAGEVAWSANAVTFPAAGAVPVGSCVGAFVAYWSGANTLAGDAGMAYNAATDTLTIVNVVISGLAAGAVQSSIAGVLSSGPLPLTDLAGYTQGDLIYGGAADWQDLAHPGAANRVLQSTAAEVGWSANAVTFPTAGAVPVGTGAASRVAYWTAASTLASDAGLLVDAANDMFVVADGGGIAIGAALERIEFYTAGYVSVMGANFGVNTVAPVGLASVVGGEVHIVDAVARDLDDTFMTYGLMLNQGAADNEIASFKSSDVAHGITAQAETDTYGFIRKVVDVSGGMNLVGLTEDTMAFANQAMVTNEVVTQGRGDVGAITFLAYKKAGATVGAMGVTANLFAVTNAASTRMILTGGGILWIIPAAGNSIKLDPDPAGFSYFWGKLGIGAVPTTLLEMAEVKTLAGNVADDYAATITLDPGYTGAFTVTRHNYMDIQDVSVAGGAAVTDAAVMRFDAALGTHKATTNADKTANAKPGTVKVNVNGTIYHIQLYAT